MILSKNMKNKLIVGGCSVSDYSCGINNTYGNLLSSYLGYDYIDESAGCGSNFRIWRRLTTMIRQNEISKDDILIVQYTTTERKEFFSLYPFNFEKDRSGDKTKSLREPYIDGSTIKFKTHSFNYYRNRSETNFLKLTENNFMSQDYDDEVFYNYQFMFQCLLKEKGIKTIFLRETNYQPLSIQTINCENHIYYSINNYFVKGYAVEGEGRYGHLNDKGHKILAKDLYKLIKNNFIE